VLGSAIGCGGVVDRLRQAGIFVSLFLDPTRHKSMPDANGARRSN